MSFKIKKLALCCALAATSASAFAATSTTVRIIAFNDFHGNLQSPGNFGIQPGGSGTATISKPSGGVDYLAGYVDYLKNGYPNNVVVSAGDLTGASPLISGAFHDEPAIETMNLLGLEFNAVGNHEFDYGQIEVLRKQHGGCYPTGVVGVDTCLGATSTATPVPVAYPFEGAKFKYLSANVTRASGKTLFPAYGVKAFDAPLKKLMGKVKVAFIGMTLKDTPSIVTPTGVAGLTFKDEVQTVNALIPELRAKGIESIVVLIHQGGFQGSTGPNYINDCSLASNGSADATALEPLRSIVQGLDDAVDLVISGHTHTGYTCQLPNSTGRNIPVTQGGNYGRVLTTVDLTVDTKSRDVIGASFNNTVVDRSNVSITPNADIKSIVDAYATNISPIANQVVATITAPVLNNDTANGGTGEKPAGDLIADGMLAATSPSKFGGAQIAFTNSGGVRADYASKAIPAVYPYNLTYGDAFTVQPFGNNLVTVTVTAQQLKDVLEMQFPGSNCALPSGTNAQIQQRIMQPSNGFKFSWSATGANCSKIQDVSLTTYDSLGTITNVDQIVSAGVVLNPTQTYRVTVNSFMATGGDGFAVFKAGTSRLGGAQDIDATVAYLAQFKAPNVAYDPSAALLHTPRVVKLP
ncbi:MAG: bifunctional metallophosphatase/5'-nucleotidase [Methylovulum sp.]|nr:bifunctional metallophosphatase/5'-nucleotidase [Methylovulum sp.]